MKCIFCEADTSLSRSIEHIIPESFGNLIAVLPKGVVCDKCNNYFARKVEGPFLGSEAIRMLRQELEIKTKNNKFITSFDYPRVGKEYVKQISDEIYLIYTKESKTPLDIDKTVREYQAYCDKTDKALMIYDSYTSRLLAKIAIEFFIYRCGSTNDVCEYVRTDAMFDSLRKYARYGNLTTWPYNVRRIYSRNKMYNGEPFNSISWEADFLFLNNGEMYLIIAMHGIEYAINMVTPSIDGYKKWLSENYNKSPLYISEELRFDNFTEYAETIYNETEKEEFQSYIIKRRTNDDN